MEFTLCYQGRLLAASNRNRRVVHKHALRKMFHKQLLKLWHQRPLSALQKFLDPNGASTPGWMEHDESGFGFDTYELSLPYKVGDFSFVPTVSTKLKMAADLEITLLRPGTPGVTQGADLDNRLKTLLDALKVPKQEELPTNTKPSKDEQPFFCLLEDDKLITNLDIKTDQLLYSPKRQEDVLLLIKVRTRILEGEPANLGLV